MKNALTKYTTQDIHSLIYVVRGVQVMIDSDLATLYEVETRRLNEQVKRNIERFPEQFMLQLTEDEYEDLKTQIDISPGSEALRSQNATLESGRGKHRKYLPRVFTEQGVAMLSAVLRSDTAVQVSIQIMDAFVKMRQMIGSHRELIGRMDRMELTLANHDKQFEKVFKALEAADLEVRQGVFFDGQTFDAYTLASKLIRSAKKSVYLVDNYIDDSVLLLLAKRKKTILPKRMCGSSSNNSVRTRK